MYVYNVCLQHVFNASQCVLLTNNAFQWFLMGLNIFNAFSINQSIIAPNQSINQSKSETQTSDFSNGEHFKQRATVAASQ